jgi:hypothetical protein
MSRIFTRKQFSNYLGEDRAILDVYTLYISGATPSETYYILFENSNVMEAENGDLIEFEH